MSSSGIATVTDCMFINNTANSGAGFCADQYSQHVTLRRCTFQQNAGGGVRNRGVSMDVIDCIFNGNSTGGGMINYGEISTIVNCLFVGNTGGGLVNTGALSSGATTSLILGCTFVENVASGSGGGMYNVSDSSPTVTNCVFWANADSGGITAESQIYNHPTNGVNVPVVTYSCVQDAVAGDLNVYPGVGNIDVNPMFVLDPDPGLDGLWDGVDDEYGDLHLQAGSPGINVGDNSAVASAGVSTDLDGNIRVLGGTVDMGAYEWPSLSPSVPTLSGPALATLAVVLLTVGIVLARGSRPARM